MPRKASTRTKRRNTNKKTVRIGDTRIEKYEPLSSESWSTQPDLTNVKECPNGYDEPDFPCIHRRMLFETMEELDYFNELMEYKSAEKRQAHYEKIRRRTPVSTRRRKPGSKTLGG